jgi:methyl-CpG-binding domain protein 4
MQEFVAKDKHYPWRVLVVCLLLNRTHGRVARTAIQQLMERCPQPEDLLETDIGDILKPLGLQTVRGQRLRAMTREYLAGKPFSEMTGIGPYALDSLDIFCWGSTALDPSDQWLKPYLEWRKMGGDAPKWDYAGYKAWRAHA